MTCCVYSDLMQASVQRHRWSVVELCFIFVKINKLMKLVSPVYDTLVSCELRHTDFITKIHGNADFAFV